MDEVLGSECSSGCESGWTLYLEHSYGHDHQFVSKNGGFTEQEMRENEEEVDLSMVSDASSGPPHFQEDDADMYNNGCCFYNPPPQLLHATTLPKSKGKMQKINENRPRKVQELPSYLDDTASSPFFNFSNNNLTVTNNQGSMENIVDFSQGYSTTYLQGKSTFQDHFGLFHSSVSGIQLQQNQWFEGKRMGMK